MRDMPIKIKTIDASGAKNATTNAARMSVTVMYIQPMNASVFA